MCEPDSPQNVYYLKKENLITDEERDKLLQSTVRLLCKPREGVERICIKPRPFCTGIMTNMSKLFPDFHHIFMYRNCRETVSSWLGIMVSVPYMVVLRAFIDSEEVSAVTSAFRKMWEGVVICHLRDYPEFYLNTNTIGIFTRMWVHFVLQAREAIARDTNILPVKFEDILSEPEKTSEIIFQKIGVDSKYLKTAISAFSKDSHRGTVLSRSRIADDPRRRISEADWLIADRILASYRLPRMGESTSL